jgi:hypothetical protein
MANEIVGPGPALARGQKGAAKARRGARGGGGGGVQVGVGFGYSVRSESGRRASSSLGIRCLVPALELGVLYARLLKPHA